MTDVTLAKIKMAWFTQDGARCIVKSPPPGRIPVAYKVVQLMQAASMCHTNN
jgi:hypothetical protein